KFEDAAESDDPTTLFNGEDPFAESNELATAIGLTECADDGEDDSGSNG
ncbi:MAG: hypothetical protein V7636_2947, partial [Actinomycetota bacterium]